MKLRPTEIHHLQPLATIVRYSLKEMEQFPDLMPKILKSVVDSVRAWEERLLIDQDGFCEACKQKAGVSLI